MSAVAVGSRSVSSRSASAVARIGQSVVAVSVGLYAVSFAVRLWAVGLLNFPFSEGSAYYVSVARNLVEGRGLVVDSLWSYTTPPLVLPRPAFELWQPMATLVMSLPMKLMSADFDTAQLGYVALGALLAPLTWLVARDFARRIELPEWRAMFVGMGAGALVAVAGPFLLATAIPDSSLPFTLLIVAACLVMPAAVRGDRRALISLGVLLGLAYLTRLEAVWAGLALVGLLIGNRTDWRTLAVRSVEVASVALLVAAPWLARQIAVFGKPFPGQAVDNFFFTRNEHVFSYLERPTLDGFLAQGVGQIAANVATAFWHDFVNVLLVPATPVVVVGLVTSVVCARRGRIGGALGALLLTGVITYVATSVLFPVATLWGTFEHASGPLLVALTVSAVVGGDAFVAWLVRRRNWARQNAWMAPAALLALTVPLAMFQLSSLARQTADEAAAVARIATIVPAALSAAGVDTATPIITDRPIWLADAMGRATLALPDEPSSSVLALAQSFGARAVVVVEGRGRYPSAFADDPCFLRLGSDPATATAATFVIHPECVR